MTRAFSAIIRCSSLEMHEHQVIWVQAGWRARNILIKARPGIEGLFIMYGSCPLPQVRMKSTQNHNSFLVLMNILFYLMRFHHRNFAVHFPIALFLLRRTRYTRRFDDPIIHRVYYVQYIGLLCVRTLPRTLLCKVSVMISLLEASCLCTESWCTCSDPDILLNQEPQWLLT